jgi:hypothetical protein
MGVRHRQVEGKVALTNVPWDLANPLFHMLQSSSWTLGHRQVIARSATGEGRPKRNPPALTSKVFCRGLLGSDVFSILPCIHVDSTQLLAMAC